MRPSTLGFLCVLWSFGLVAAARAQTEAGSDGEARTHFEAAQAHFETGSYEDAIREFEEAYRLSGRTALLYNVYLCHERLGNLDAAIDFLSRYLDLDPETSNASALRLRLEKLRARAAARQPDEPDEPVVTPAEPVAQPVDDGVAEPGNPHKPATITALAIGGAGFVSFGVFATLTAQKDAELEQTCGDSCSDSEVKSLRTNALLADISLGVGVTGLIVSGVLWWTGRPHAVTVAPVAGRGQVGLLAEGRF